MHKIQQRLPHEATWAQIDLMKGIMQWFCGALGHKINLNKSKVFFSKNIHFNRAQELSHELGIGITGDLGKYLGVPLLHKRATKLTFTPYCSELSKG